MVQVRLLGSVFVSGFLQQMLLISTPACFHLALKTLGMKRINGNNSNVSGFISPLSFPLSICQRVVGDEVYAISSSWDGNWLGKDFLSKTFSVFVHAGAIILDHSKSSILRLCFISLLTQRLENVTSKHLNFAFLKGQLV